MILACILLSQQNADLPKAGEIVSKMIARYHGAKTITGDYSATARIGVQTVTVNSTIQIERPNKIYLSQDVAGRQMRYFLTSDGKTFSYQKPPGAPFTDRNPEGRLIEDVTAQTTLGDIFHAASRSLAERSALLDLLVSDMEDLRMLRDQWMTMDLTGEVDLNGEKVYRIVGKWRVNKISPAAANYGLFVTKDGDLKKYVLDQLPTSGSDQTGEVAVDVSTEVVANITVNGEVNPRLFTVLK